MSLRAALKASAGRFNWGFSLVHESELRWALAVAFSRFKSIRVLDVGAYKCGMLSWLEQNFPRDRYSWWYVGVDVLGPEGVPESCEFYVMNAEALEFPAGSFHAVVFVETLEHVVDYVKALREAHRVLVPRGVLFVQSVDARHPASVTDPTHFHVLRPETLSRLLSHLGFKVLRTAGGNSFAVVAEKVV